MSPDAIKTEPKKDIHRIFVEDGDLILEALEQGVREARSGTSNLGCQWSSSGTGRSSE
jgi:hypothetical protein